MRRLFPLCLFAFLFACQPQEEPAQRPEAKAEAVISEALRAHGSHLVDSSSLEFSFRQYNYQVFRQGGKFLYVRSFIDSSGALIRDQLTNDSLQRTVNGEPLDLTPKDSAGYAGSVNSVVYFALLPYFLQDEAVNAVYLGETTIKESPYHKIGVTFRQEGGGTDYEDEYVYWVHQEQHTVDYLAYNYQVNGGGARFREAFNVRSVEGLRIADYRNYKPKTDTRAVATFDSLFQAGELEQVSLIETENVRLSR